MYEIVFYEKSDGSSDIFDFIESLRESSKTNKDARIQYKQVTLYIELLQKNGTRMSDNITKHIQDNIWELRPGDNRIFYFSVVKNKFVLLHHFRKKTRKTPKSEIDRALRERDDYIARNGDE
nr:type II toxin-antitoxin system RelE/ParE family toxin [Clostridia bacterium]